ncbi:hypothetical protein BY458DRAFT_508611 [Sporodiniella umbellata]|nr:hypothetical protein BY458DRAFT_508611 [Sporodiniella umbellata]
MTIPSVLFVQFIEQGISKGLVKNITRTLDGEHYLDNDFIIQVISKHVETQGKISVETLAGLLSVEHDTVSRLVEKAVVDKHWLYVDDLVITQ